MLIDLVINNLGYNDIQTQYSPPPLAAARSETLLLLLLVRLLVHLNPDQRAVD